MGNWPRLVLLFESDTILDLKRLHETLCQSYDIGYLGLYNSGTHMSVYLQTGYKDSKMTPAKVFKICKEFGLLQTPANFKRREGILVSEIGILRKGGTQKGSTKKTGSVTNTVVNNNITNNTVNHHDNSVTNNVVNVHIHPVGEEDVSRITIDQFKGLLGGGKEAIIDHMKREMSSEAYQEIIEEAWHGLQEVLFEKQYDERIAAAMAPPDVEPVLNSGSDASDESSDEEGPMMTPFRYSMLTVNGEPLKYDAQHNSAYNQQVKEKVGTISILERSAVVTSNDLPHEFAELMYDNPHNCNVKHPTNSGSFECFDGTRWKKKRVDQVHLLVQNWGEKAKEFYDLLTERHGSEWTDSFDGKYAEHVIDMFKYHHPCCAKILKFLDTRAKQCALLAIENANKNIEGVHARTGKRVHRVLSESDFEVRDKKVLRATSWEELLSKT